MPRHLPSRDYPPRYLPVVDCPDYRVGDDGSVWTRFTGGGRIKGKKGKWRKLKPYPSGRSGHLRVSLLDKNGRRRQRLVHCLVLEAFVGPCPLGMECRHFPDRDPENNNLFNIQWGTSKQNAKDREFHGTNKMKGETHWKARLTDKQVAEMRRMYETGEYRQSELATIFKTSRTNVWFIVNYRSRV
jgi:hypothetical protein